jgi:hypothetical protein
LESFRHPYYCEVDRRVYEKAALIAWVRDNGTSPITRQMVRLDQLRPLDSDDDDNESISSEMGWPRPRNKNGRRTASASSSSNNSKSGNRQHYAERGINFKAALLNGGGGVESKLV